MNRVQEENHARAELERRKQEQRLRERNRRQREIAEERRLRELKKKVRLSCPKLSSGASSSVCIIRTPFLSSFSSSAKRSREEPRNAASIPRSFILAHIFHPCSHGVFRRVQEPERSPVFDLLDLLDCDARTTVESQEAHRFARRR